MRSGRDRGQTSAAYLGMVVVVATIVGSLVTTGMPQTIGDGLQLAVCRIVSMGGDCDSGASGGETAGADDDAGSENDDDPDDHDDQDECVVAPEPGDPDIWNDQYVDQAEADAAAIDALLGDRGLGDPVGVLDPSGPNSRMIEIVAEEGVDAALEEFGAEGLLDSFDIAAMDYEGLDESFPELVELFEQAGPLLQDEGYATTLVNSLGPENTRVLMDLAQTFGLGHFLEDQLDEVYDGYSDRDDYNDHLNAIHGDYVDPLATLLGTADQSGLMDSGIRDEIVSMDPPRPSDAAPELTDGAIARLSRELTLQRQRANALILHGGDFSSQTTADLAEGIIFRGPQAMIDGSGGLREGFGEPEFFTNGAYDAGHQALASSHWVAFEALAEDPRAAALFYGNDDHVAVAEAFPEDHDGLLNINLVVDVAAFRLDEYLPSGVSGPREEITERLEGAATDSLEARCP